MCWTQAIQDFLLQILSLQTACLTLLQRTTRYTWQCGHTTPFVVNKTEVNMRTCQLESKDMWHVGWHLLLGEDLWVHETHDNSF